MVQLSQSPLRGPPPSCHSEEGDEKSMKPAKQQVTQGPRGDNQPPLSPLQAALNSTTTASQAYETYIDNGLICLKHKIRNIEKKKLKLEDYKDRLKKGEPLNQDQLEAVEKYDEVIHNLEFARELQKTFSGLSQDLLKAQRKAQRRETIMKLEAEKKKLRTVLQVQYVLQNFTQEHVQKDFKAGMNGAIYLPSKELDYLIKFAKLTCSGRNENISVEDQMEQSSLYFWDLLEGSEKAVVGTTYKHLKDLLSKLLNSGYFENIPAPCNILEKEELKEEMPIRPELKEEMSGRPEKTRHLSKAESVNESEPQVEHIQSEIQPQEFLNRRYLPEADYTIKSEESRPWEMEHAKRNEPLKSWEMLVDMEEQEQKKREQESVKPLESVRQQGKKLELLRPWEAHLKEDKDCSREVPKPWVTQVREQQGSPKPWVTKLKEEQEQKQDVPKPWVSKAKEEAEQKQEMAKTWVAQIRVETVQKPEPVKPWGMCVREETEQKKRESAKPWLSHIGEEAEQKTQSPKAWETSEGPRRTVQQPLQNSSKIWGAGNLVPKEQTGPKKPDLEPKERREHRLKLESDMKQDGKTDGVSGQSTEAARKKESLHSIGESCKLPRSLQNIMQGPKSVHQPAAEFCFTSSLPKDPVLRREKLQDLMTQIQGTYNFIQESLLDFDKPSQSAICSSQAPLVDSTASSEQLSSQNNSAEQPVQAAAAPMTLHGSNTSLASDNTLSGSETELGSSQTSVPHSQESENFSSPQPLYQAKQEISEPLMSPKSEIAQAPTLSSESQIPVTPSRTTTSPVLQESSPPSSSTVNVTAPPFQAMQTVFKVNAPLPPRREQDTKENSLHPTGYNQNFSTASTQTPPQCKLQSTQNSEQPTFSQESLPNAGNYQVEGAVPVSNSNLTFYAAQTTTFPRPPQPFVTSRGSIRGPLRGARSVTNSYRSPGGYKGFEAYRGTPSVPNGTYGQLQIPGRDYPPVQYPQRDVNYQQNYKRGSINSGRANSRAGWSDSSQVSSPERDSETFNSGDSGQGDSRSITPVDMPVTSQAPTILPVHVYPLPQQMRVAFSAARTSNLAPGTLDQPIVFDLLLNNLGETFDIQLGRFNCPVNGTYVFIFHMLKLAVNVPLYVNLMKNEEVLVSAYANDGAPDHETASNHAVLQLFQGDQIWLRLHRGAIYGSSWKYSTFSGYLLYQD
ncbi:caprin-2 isoform X2 [Elgaria multicarinata webbii]|uniref:caprin-2 isoform X2 n=1 Tax=Elgaria multicarinata webbii TaxID=159646 RepID=UPI002FCD2A3F